MSHTCLVLALLAMGQDTPDATQPGLLRIDQLKPGLQAEEIVKLVGKPQRISRQVYLHRVIEQWHYAEPVQRRLTLERLRGQPGVLVRVQKRGP
ncbi:MAG: hypothetical protein U0840_12195 [Gemmataceae bacterium]